MPPPSNTPLPHLMSASSCHHMQAAALKVAPQGEPFVDYGALEGFPARPGQHDLPGSNIRNGPTFPPHYNQPL